MRLTYKIVDIVVKHDKLGSLDKKNIIYLKDGKELTREFYTGDASCIKEGFEPDDDEQPKKMINLSKIDIDSLTDEQIEKLKTRLKL